MQHDELDSEDVIYVTEPENDGTFLFHCYCNLEIEAEYSDEGGEIFCQMQNIWSDPYF
jgi:hypothetical protein